MDNFEDLDLVVRYLEFNLRGILKVLLDKDLITEAEVYEAVRQVIPEGAIDPDLLRNAIEVNKKDK